jgi:hypothetical protein
MANTNFSTPITSTMTTLKVISRKKRNSLESVCGDIRDMHLSADIDIKHYACFVPHGRAKSSREKDRYRTQ